MIEPNEAMADISKKLFMSDSNVDVIASGVWDKNTFLKLNINGSISSVNGIDIKKNESEELIENVVPAIALDELFYNSKISLIKMDIEGAEKKALFGAKKLIATQKPKLAIAIYHRPEDIWEIPNAILEINPEYKFYMRHYTLCEYDTILYAI